MSNKTQIVKSPKIHSQGQMSEKKAVFVYINLKKNDYKTMSTNTQQVTCCSFPPSFNTNSHYYCYDDEICCEYGCCIKSAKQFYQFWYYWLALVVAFGILATIRWIYKRAKYKRALARIERSRSEESSPRGFNSYYSNFMLSPPLSAEGSVAPSLPRIFHSMANEHGDDNDVMLSHLFATFRNHLSAEPPGYVDPPDYDSLSTKKASLPYLGPPPKYSSTCLAAAEPSCPGETEERDGISNTQEIPASSAEVEENIQTPSLEKTESNEDKEKNM